MMIVVRLVHEGAVTGLYHLKLTGMTARSTSSGNRRGKVARICQLLRKDILSGRYKAGMMLPTQIQLGESYGVAEATAGAAMGRLAHEGLVVRIHGRGSFVAEDIPLAQETVDLLWHRYAGMEGVFALHWIEALSRAVEAQQLIPRWHYISSDQAEGVQKLENLAARFSGSKLAIILCTAPVELPFLLWRQKTSVVAVVAKPGGLGEKPEVYPQVSYSRRESARLATNHLVSLGYSRIGFLELETSPLRTCGFMDSLREHGLNVDSRWLVSLPTDIYSPGDMGDRLCRKLCEKVLKDTDRPQAFCCSTSRMAQVVEAVAYDLGLRVPQDLGLVGCDETELSVSPSVSLTTVAISRDECCQKAVELLEEVRHSDATTDRLTSPVLMPLRLTIRDSCGARLKGFVASGTEGANICSRAKGKEVVAIRQ